MDLSPRRLGLSFRFRWWKYVLKRRDEVTFRFDRDLSLYAPTRNLSTKFTYVKRYKDPEVFQWMDGFLKPGMTALDVGANVGTYTLFIAKRVGTQGKVVAIEPGSANLKFLRRNVEANRLSQVVIAPVAVGSEPGHAKLVVVESNAGQNHIEAAGEAAGSSDEVPITRLDDLVDEMELGQVSFVKMDIEGFEGHALRGFERTLRVQSPVLLIEHASGDEPHYGFTRAENRTFLEGLGYVGKELVDGEFKLYDWEHSAEDTFWFKA